MKAVNYLKEVRTELKLVVWPDRQQVMRLTSNVIIISIMFGAFLGVLDYIFTTLAQSALR